MGGAVWVASAMLDGRRTVMAPAKGPVTLRQSPADTAPPSAYLRPRAVALLGDCKGDWCRVSAEDASGWVKSSEVWGLAPQAQCR